MEIRRTRAREHEEEEGFGGSVGKESSVVVDLARE